MGKWTAGLHPHPFVNRREVMTTVLVVVAGSVAAQVLSACGDAAQAGDNFTYYAGQHSGAGKWSCEVAALAQADGWVAAGIMIRQTLDPASADLYFVTTADSGASLQYRRKAHLTAESGPTIDPLAATPIHLQMEYTPASR